METLNQLLSNKILFIPISAWVIAQISKTLFGLIISKRFSLERLYGAGGMPSAHAALVCALAITSARILGVDSEIFAISVLFAAVVMYDAMGVRHAVGEQAKIINRLVDSLEEEEGENNTGELKEVLGHTPLEVLAGALLGILVAIFLV